jgi:hypothetical protein
MTVAKEAASIERQRKTNRNKMKRPLTRSVMIVAGRDCSAGRLA